jgi:phosphate transport system ATP-binding protein
MRIEDVLKDLREELTIILVTNLVQQARRLADRTAFFLNGELVELAGHNDFETARILYGMYAAGLIDKVGTTEPQT